MIIYILANYISKCYCGLTSKSSKPSKSSKLSKLLFMPIYILVTYISKP